MNHCQFCQKETVNTYCSLSCSNRSRTAKNIARYELNPKRCQHCNEPIAYKARFESIYCSHSCAASITNKVPKRKKKPILKTTISHHDNALSRFPLGLVTNRSTLRRCLRETMGDLCVLCKQPAIWNNQSLTLVVDHVDGDVSNNMPSNLRLLCPNCNSQTPTFCGRNLGKGRRARGISER